MSRRDRGGTLRAEDVALPEVARGLLHDRIATLDPATRATLSAASVLGEDFELALLTRICDTPVEPLLRCLDGATQARFIERTSRADAYAFSHAMIREALYDALPSAERKRLHGRAATALQSLVAEPRLSAIAHHLHLALPEGKPRDVARYSRMAGDSAMQVFAYDEAAKLYGWALDAHEYADGTDARVTCELLLAAGNAHRRAGRVRESRSLARRAIEIAERENYGELLVETTRSLRPTVWMAQVPDTLVLRALEHARKILPENAKVARAQAYGHLAGVPPHASSIETSRALSEQGLRLAREVGDQRLVVEALLCTFHSLTGPDSIESLLAATDEVLRLDDARLSWASAEAFFGRYIALLHRADGPGAERAIEAFGECARLLRMPEATLQYERVRAQQAVYAGDLDRAEARFQELFSRSSAFPSYGTFQYMAHMSALRWARTGAAMPMTHTALGSSADVSWRWAAAIPAFRAEKILMLLAAEDRTAAATQFDEIARDEFRGITRDLSYLYTLAKLALAAVALERRHEAQVLEALLLPYRTFCALDGMSISLGSVTHHLGVLATFLGKRDDAARWLEQAVATNTALGYVVHARRSLAELASVRP
jgi:tetratricopeptide (TPR) repeat protein